MKWILILLFLLVLLLFIGPLYFYIKLENLDWRFADRESSRQAPDPKKTKEAVIQIYGARAFNWRGAFALHTWISIKEKDEPQYTTYQVVGWNFSKGKSVLMVQKDLPDRNWFGSKPQLFYSIIGDEAESLIPKVKEQIDAYPYKNEYVVWPGPNSNTFVATIARGVPELRVVMPPNALGKDYLLPGKFFAKTASGTGFQFSFYGIFGVAIGKLEGIELTILGLIIGFNPLEPAIYLPGFGKIKI